MSRTKKLTRARRREAELRTALLEVIADNDTLAANLYRLLARHREIEEKLRPAVERIMAIQLNSTWYFPIHEEMAMYVSRQAIDAAIKTRPFRSRSIDTHRKLHVTYAVADEVMLEMLTEKPEPIVEKFFLDVGKQLLLKAMAATGIGVPR